MTFLAEQELVVGKSSANTGRGDKREMGEREERWVERGGEKKRERD